MSKGGLAQLLLVTSNKSHWYRAATMPAAFSVY